jgi:hypothetical protein
MFPQNVQYLNFWDSFLYRLMHKQKYGWIIVYQHLFFVNKPLLFAPLLFIFLLFFLHIKFLMNPIHSALI